MKGKRTLIETPFRYGGIMHDFDKDVEEWRGVIHKRCWCCGGDMTRNLYSTSGALLKKSYPYIAEFRISKGKHKGMCWFKTLCRACAYDYGRGVVEMDGYKYMKPNEFDETQYKRDLEKEKKP